VAAQAQAQMDAQLKDVENARALQIVALQQDDKFSKRYVYYLATVVILIVAAFDFCLFGVRYPVENRDMINMVAGILNSGALIMILSFFFGSSAGTRKANETISRIAESP